MTFAGLGNPEDRANIIAYMNAQGSNLPLPTPEAAPAADAATNEAAAPEAPGAGTGDANAEHGAAETGGQTADRKSVEEGKRVSGRVDIGGRGNMKKQIKQR